MSAWFGALVLLAGCRADPLTTEVPIEVPPGELHVPTRTLAYGLVPLHETSQLDLVLSNVGVGTLYIHDLQLSDDTLRAHWSILGAVEQSIAPGDTLLVPIALTPRDVLDPSVVLTVLSSDPSTPRMPVELSADVQGDAVLRLEPTSLAFGDVPLNQDKTLDILLSNLGSDDLVITGLTLDAEEGFTVIIDPTDSSLAPGQSNGLASIRFVPQGTGNHSGLLTFASNDPDRPEIAVLLTGTGR